MLKPLFGLMRKKTGDDLQMEYDPERAQPRIALKERTIAAVAHELKNPVQAMTGLLYLLQHNSSLNEEAHQSVCQLTQELERIGHIINETLGLYRDSATPVAVRLSEVLDTVLGFYAHKIQFKHIAIYKHYKCIGLTQGFPEELRQVFTNLVVNALEALPVKGGKLRVHILSSREWIKSGRRGIRVVIADNGSGIRQEDCKNLFQSLFTTKGEKGTGLGLWVSAGIVRKHLGSIRARSTTRPGHSGTVFSVFFPANLGNQVVGAGFAAF